MARIRTIKPEFFRHEALQDLEIAHPGKYPMMVFAGLLGHCDSKGRFEWRPRQLKLDILPFLPFDMADTLAILERAGMLFRYVVDGREYGGIPSFEKHQRLSGKELTEGERFPEPPCEAIGKQQGSDGEIPESQEGKGREGKEEGNGVAPVSPALPPKPSKRSMQLPTDFYPNETGVAYAEQRKVSTAVEMESFRNWHAAKGSTMKDWQAAWRTWCDKAVEFARAGQAPNARASPLPNAAQERAEVSRILTGRVSDGQGRDITGEAKRVA